MEFKSRIFATSRGSTIDAIGDGKYLVCNPVFSHGSERGLFLTLHGLMGLTEPMHHEAIGRIADQISAFADGVDGGPA